MPLVHLHVGLRHGPLLLALLLLQQPQLNLLQLGMQLLVLLLQLHQLQMRGMLYILRESGHQLPCCLHHNPLLLLLVSCALLLLPLHHHLHALLLLL